MKIEENKSLKDLNTFGVDVTARYFAEVTTTSELQTVLAQFPTERKFILGDGSNTLFAKDFPGLVIRPYLQGISKVAEDDKTVTLKVAAGEDWHEFVTYCVNNGWAGVENLALIPGTMGAAPVQNIAAYGQNLTDTFVKLEFVDNDGEIHTYEQAECKFGYRSSIFKQEPEVLRVITNVYLQLNKAAELETSYHERAGRYGSLQEVLAKTATEPYDIKDIYNAVIDIRSRKLPDPAITGTVGSTFKNPMVTKTKFLELSQQVPELQHYPVDNLRYQEKAWDEVEEEMVKIPAARLLDFLGWKGFSKGHVGVYDKHALCVVTDKQASGEAVLDLIRQMQADVKAHFDILLETEVNIIQ